MAVEAPTELDDGPCASAVSAFPPPPPAAEPRAQTWPEPPGDRADQDQAREGVAEHVGQVGVERQGGHRAPHLTRQNQSGSGTALVEPDVGPTWASDRKEPNQQHRDHPPDPGGAVGGGEGSLGASSRFSRSSRPARCSPVLRHPPRPLPSSLRQSSPSGAQSHSTPTRPRTPPHASRSGSHTRRPQSVHQSSSTRPGVKMVAAR